MPRNPITLGKTMLSVSHVRYELYELWNRIIRRQNHHVSAWIGTPEGHPTPCKVCEEFDARMMGVKEAIKHFGGTPRWDR